MWTKTAAVLVAGLALAAAGLGSAAEAATAIGKVTRIAGSAAGTVDGVHRVLAADDPVYRDEYVVTGAGARLEMTLDDASVLTVGGNATMTLDDFVYRPHGAGRLAATIVGAFRLVSGALAPGATRAARVTTPFAVIAVRGTDVWGGPIDNTFGVLLIEGAVSVANAGTTVELTAPGQGVSFANAAAAPGAVVVWSRDKVARALATVSFR